MLNETAENFTSILARLRQNMELECSDSLPPGISVTWEFNSTRLLPSDKYVITVNGSLLVRNVQLEDMGEYQCVVNGVRLTRELVIEGTCVRSSLVPRPSCPAFVACIMKSGKEAM